MRAVRIFVEENDTGFTCDLTFHASTMPHEEPGNHVRRGGHRRAHEARKLRG
jgi:hypothetical protein